jgi:hypothetical protein
VLIIGPLLNTFQCFISFPGSETFHISISSEQHIFWLVRYPNPKLEIGFIMDHNTAIKLNIFNIFADIHMGMTIYPIPLTFILETKFFYTDGADVNLFDFYLVVDY